MFQRPTGYVTPTGTVVSAPATSPALTPIYQPTDWAGIIGPIVGVTVAIFVVSMVYMFGDKVIGNANYERCSVNTLCASTVLNDIGRKNTEQRNAHDLAKNWLASQERITTQAITQNAASDAARAARETTIIQAIPGQTRIVGGSVAPRNSGTHVVPGFAKHGASGGCTMPDGRPGKDIGSGCIAPHSIRYR